MAPQTEIPVAANVLGTIGTVLWCIQLIPQIWTNWRTKSTDGLPWSMMFLWAISGVPFGAYAIVQNFNIPIQLQSQIFMALALTSLSQTLIYTERWKPWKAISTSIALAVTLAGAEAALIIPIRPLYEAGNETPILIIGIIAAILLAAGLIPPYWEIWKRRGRVIGINWLFLTCDWLGAFISLMALVAQNTFDVLGGVLYIIVCLLELGIFVMHIVWRFRTRKIRKAAAAEGKTFDDVAREHEVAGAPFKFAERRWRRKRRPSTNTGPDEEQGEATVEGEKKASTQQESDAPDSGVLQPDTAVGWPGLDREPNTS